ncbi:MULTISPECIES: YhcN/YlaJ family sporulation lipoprotein [Gracilibacillus]|uniref:YhcN/YlaJ family sporulation lipoprotein n=1 Tax=Gracilibacillus TaxID=74385 RepID=UPI000826843E|nr:MULTISPECIES: YhcN/YlaJ family sporulation lipoprotein [Gracilibacillus]
MKYIIMTVLIFLLFGCQQEQPEQSTAESPNQLGTIQLKNADPSLDNELKGTEKAQYLANLASQVPNVNGATALVTKRGSLVSIDVDKDLDQSSIGSIKYAVLEALEHDTQGSKAIIVADSDLYERMKGIGNKMKEGHPVEAVSEELANITSRWMPEFPVDENRSTPPDENKQIIDNQEEQNLDNIQEDQSNHHK